MATATVTRPGSGAWVKIAFAMFAVGWGANQFSPMLIVYRHELRLGAVAVAGLFLVYALTLIPGLLVGGPASDRFGRRPVVLPFVALSPLATLLLVLGPRSLVLISAGRALAGLCSGVVFSSATAWVQDLSQGTGQSARRAALALTAGFGLGPVVAAVLAQPSGFRPEMPDLFYNNNIKGWGPALCARRPDVTMAMVDAFLKRMYGTNPDFVFTVTRDFVRGCQTPILVLPDDVPAHPYAVAAIRVRRWDDQAKEPDVEPPPFSHFEPVLRALAR